MMTKTKGADRVSVESLSVAAACIANGAKLAELNQLSPGRFGFVLEGPGVDLDAAAYVIGTLHVNARDFMRHFDDLRTLIRRGPAAGGAK